LGSFHTLFLPSFEYRLIFVSSLNKTVSQKFFGLDDHSVPKLNLLDIFFFDNIGRFLGTQLENPFYFRLFLTFLGKASLPDFSLISNDNFLDDVIGFSLI
jgi:hypothetical protein